MHDLVWVYDDDDALFWPGKVMTRTDAGYRVQMFVNLAAYGWVLRPRLDDMPPWKLTPPCRVCTHARLQRQAS